MGVQREDGSTGGEGNLTAGPASGGVSDAESPTTAADRTRLAAGAEFDLIRRFLREPRVGSDEVLIGPGDDAAVLRTGGIVLSSDLSVEDVHFRRDWLAPFDIGYRATAASLSDLAAMAAQPVGVLVSLGLAATDAGEFAVELMRGVQAAVEGVDGTLLGGDLTSSPRGTFLDVVSVGRAERPIRRRGAMPGDEIWVTGVLGGASLVVRALLEGAEPDPGAMPAFASPVPRIREALWLADRGLAVAMLDISDGLGGDAGHLAAAGGVAIVLTAEAVPVHDAVRAALPPDDALRQALSGGEDYELCFAARPGAVMPHRQAFRDFSGCELTCVGYVEPGEGVFLERAGRRTLLTRGGFQHFGDRR